MVRRDERGEDRGRLNAREVEKAGRGRVASSVQLRGIVCLQQSEGRVKGDCRGERDGDGERALSVAEQLRGGDDRDSEVHGEEKSERAKEVSQDCVCLSIHR